MKKIGWSGMEHFGRFGNEGKKVSNSVSGVNKFFNKKAMH